MGELNSVFYTTAMIQGGVEIPELLARPAVKNFDETRRILSIKDVQTSIAFRNAYIQFAIKEILKKFQGQEPEELSQLLNNTLTDMFSGEPKFLNMQTIGSDIYQQILQTVEDIYINIWRILNQTTIVLDTNNLEDMFKVLERNFETQES
ncbi:MAG: hypothetical protein ABIM99_01430 [Candidatus Dojkabacteria bacterium]